MINMWNEKRLVFRENPDHQIPPRTEKASRKASPQGYAREEITKLNREMYDYSPENVVDYLKTLGLANVRFVKSESNKMMNMYEVELDDKMGLNIQIQIRPEEDRDMGSIVYGQLYLLKWRKDGLFTTKDAQNPPDGYAMVGGFYVDDLYKGAMDLQQHLSKLIKEAKKRVLEHSLTNLE